MASGKNTEPSLLEILAEVNSLATILQNTMDQTDVYNATTHGISDLSAATAPLRSTDAQKKSSDLNFFLAEGSLLKSLNNVKQLNNEITGCIANMTGADFVQLNKSDPTLTDQQKKVDKAPHPNNTIKASTINNANSSGRDNKGNIGAIVNKASISTSDRISPTLQNRKSSGKNEDSSSKNRKEYEVHIGAKVNRNKCLSNTGDKSKSPNEQSSCHQKLYDLNN